MGLRVLPGGGVEQSPVQWWRATAAACRRLAARADGDAPAAVAVTAQWAGTVPVGADGEALSDALIWMDARGPPFVRRAAGGPIRVRRLRTAAPGPLAAPHRRRAGAERTRPVRPHPLAPPRAPRGLRRRGGAARARGLARPVPDRPRRHHPGHGHAALAHRHPRPAPHPLRRRAAAGRRRGRRPTARAAAHATPCSARSRATPPRRSASRPACRSSRARRTRCRPRSAPAPWPTAPHTSTSARRRGCPATSPFKKTDPLHAHRLAARRALPGALPRLRRAADRRRLARDGARPLARGHAGRRAATPSSTRSPRRRRAGSGGVLFCPWLNGERTPVDDHLVRGGWLNLGLDTTRAHLVRAVLEGVALNARWMQGPVERFAGRRLDPIAFVGGGARSPLWCQIMADVLDREIRASRRPDPRQRARRRLPGRARARRAAVDDIPGARRRRRGVRPDPGRAATYDAPVRRRSSRSTSRPSPIYAA